MAAVTKMLPAPTIAGAKPKVHPRLGDKGLRIIDAPKKDLLQCHGYNPSTGLWYMTQAASLGKGKHESLIINHFNNTGGYLRRAVLYGGGHGSSWGFIGNSIMTQFDDIGTNKKVKNRRVALIPATWVGNKRDTSSGVKFFDPTSGYMSPVTDTVHRKVGIRSVNSVGMQTFRRYDWTEFVGRRYKVEQQVSFAKLGTFQGWATFGDTFWTLWGKTDGRAFIYEYKWTTATRILAKPVAKLEVTDLLKSRRRTSYEPEGLFVVNFAGLTTLTMGARFGSVARREFIVYNVCSILNSTVQTEAAVRLVQDWPVKRLSVVALKKARSGKYLSRHVWCLQHMLWKQGTYRSKIDGKWGPDTERAYYAGAKLLSAPAEIGKPTLDKIRLAAIRQKLSDSIARPVTAA